MSPLSHINGDPRLMLGTSPGKRGKHKVDALPLDTATYMIRADLEAKSRQAFGILLALDQRLEDEDVDKKDQALISARTEHLRALTQRLTDLIFVTDKDLDADQLEAIKNEWPLEMFWEGQHSRYFQRQQAVVLESLGVGTEKPNGVPLAKFGWTIDEGESGFDLPGEKQFDQYLPEGIEPVYTTPGRNNDGEWKVPYLQNSSNKCKDRVLIPGRSNQVERELNKVQPGIARVTHAQLLATAKVVVGDEKPETLNTPELASIGVHPSLQGTVTDQREINDLRQALEAALTQLAS